MELRGGECEGGLIGKEAYWKGRLTGRGKALTIAKLTLTMAANWRREAASLRATSAPAATMAKGPETASLVCLKLVTTERRPAQRYILQSSLPK